MDKELPTANWHMALAYAIEHHQAGDRIIVHTEAQVELARGAIERMRPNEDIPVLLKNPEQNTEHKMVTVQTEDHYTLGCFPLPGPGEQLNLVYDAGAGEWNYTISKNTMHLSETRAEPMSVNERNVYRFSSEQEPTDIVSIHGVRLGQNVTIRRADSSPANIIQQGRRKIYVAHDGSCTIAEVDFGWLPGIYADQTAAQRAFDLTYEDLQQLSDFICPIGGMITLDMLEDMLEGLRNHQAEGA